MASQVHVIGLDLVLSVPSHQRCYNYIVEAHVIIRINII